MEIAVPEDSPDKIHIVLPSLRQELLKMELLSVSGGGCRDHGTYKDLYINSFIY